MYINKCIHIKRLRSNINSQQLARLIQLQAKVGVQACSQLISCRRPNNTSAKGELAVNCLRRLSTLTMIQQQQQQ